MSKNEIIEFSLGESVIRLKEEYAWILEAFPCVGNIYKTGKSLVAVRNMIFEKKQWNFLIRSWKDWMRLIQKKLIKKKGYKA